MSMAFSILLTALLSSILTLGILSLVAKRMILPKLKLWLQEEMLPEFREQVKNGAVDSGDILLPKFRENVRDGFNDAVRDQMAGQVFEDAAKTVAKKMETGLGAIWGRRPD